MRRRRNRGSALSKWQTTVAVRSTCTLKIALVLLITVNHWCWRRRCRRWTRASRPATAVSTQKLSTSTRLVSNRNFYAEETCCFSLLFVFCPPVAAAALWQWSWRAATDPCLHIYLFSRMQYNYDPMLCLRAIAKRFSWNLEVNDESKRFQWCGINSKSQVSGWVDHHHDHHTRRLMLITSKLACPMLVTGGLVTMDLYE